MRSLGLTAEEQVNFPPGPETFFSIWRSFLQTRPARPGHLAGGWPGWRRPEKLVAVSQAARSGTGARGA